MNHTYLYIIKGKDYSKETPQPRYGHLPPQGGTCPSCLQSHKQEERHLFFYLNNCEIETSRLLIPTDGFVMSIVIYSTVKTILVALPLIFSFFLCRLTFRRRSFAWDAEQI